MDTPGFIHTVFFWLRPEVSQDQRKAFEAGMEALGKDKNILRYYYGKPSKSERDVVDDSFDYSWIVHFKDKAAHDQYQVNSPEHDIFISGFKDLWAKVQVFDTLTTN